MANKRFIARNGIDANGLTVVNAADPVNAQDLVTKAYLAANSGSSSVALGAVQCRRTTTFTTTTTYTDVTLDIVDNVVNPSVCDRDPTNTARLVAYQAGTYEIVTELTYIAGNTAAVLNCRYLKNGATALPQTVSQRTSSTTSRDNLSLTALVTLAANDYVTLQANHTSNSCVVQSGAIISMKKLEGATGATGAMGGDSSFYYHSSSLDAPNSADWAVNSTAPLISDPANLSLTVKSFDDTLEEGAGATVYVPPTATNLQLSITHKCSTAPASVKSVILRLYDRTIPIGSAIPAWGAATQLNAVSIPTNTFYQTFIQTLTLASLGITAGSIVQLELTRHGANANDTLVGDWHLLNLTVSFS